MKFDKEKYILLKIKRIDKRLKELNFYDFELKMIMNDLKLVFLAEWDKVKE